MKQKERIHDFLGQLLHSELTEKQCALVLGQKENEQVTEEEQAENVKHGCTNGNCKNDRMELCNTVNKICTNYIGCGYGNSIENSFYCENVSEIKPKTKSKNKSKKEK